jgi:hypothetical protein
MTGTDDAFFTGWKTGEVDLTPCITNKTHHFYTHPIEISNTRVWFVCYEFYRMLPSERSLDTSNIIIGQRRCATKVGVFAPFSNAHTNTHIHTHKHISHVLRWMNG